MAQSLKKVLFRPKIIIFSVCSIIFLENIGHDEYVERKKNVKKLCLGVAKILQK